jgi:hypothetical protein
MVAGTGGGVCGTSSSILYRIQSFTFLLFNKFILQYLFLDIM